MGLSQEWEPWIPLFIIISLRLQIGSIPSMSGHTNTCMYVCIYMYVIYIYKIHTYIWIYCIVCVQAFVYDTHTCIPMKIWNVQVQYINSYRMMILYDTQHDNKTACVYLYICVCVNYVNYMYVQYTIYNTHDYIILHPQISTCIPSPNAK